VDGSVITIELNGGRTAFRPGELATGSVAWRLDQPATDLEVRLFWFTQGKGTKDVRVTAIRRINVVGSQGRGGFRFKLPDSPYSFSGKLISLTWAIEAVAQPGERSARVEIVVAPEGKEVRLDTAPASA
jgi:hypothetical protein